MPDKQPTETSLKRQSFLALKWNYLGSLSRAGLQFLIGIVLARLLGPEAFGLVAIASLILGLGALFADFGLASALVQRKEIDTRDIRYVFSLQTLLGFALTLLLEIGAVHIASFFKRPDALPILQALFLTFAIQGLGQTSAALLRRNMDFRRLQMAQIASYLIGYLAVGLPMAFHGMGVWSLVAAQLLQTTLNTCITYAMARHSVVPKLTSTSTGFVQFGLKVTATNLCNWGLSCIDSVVIGRVFGSTHLGLYNRAFSLVAMPTYNIVTSLQGVLFSATSRMQGEDLRVQQTYYAAIGVMGFICLPIFLVVAVIPHTMIAGVYGDNWLEAVPLLTPLALAMPFSALMGLGGPVMTGVGKAGHEMVAQFFSLATFLPLLYFASEHSIQAVAWAVFASYVLRFVSITHLTLRLLVGSWVDVASALRGPLILAGACALLSWGVDYQLRDIQLANSVRLLAVGVFAAITAVALLLMGQRWLLSKPVAMLVRQSTHALPAPLRRLVTL